MPDRHLSGLTVRFRGCALLPPRWFLEPFRMLAPEPRVFLVGQATWGLMSDPTKRFEQGGLRSANFETAVWRWLERGRFR